MYVLGNIKIERGGLNEEPAGQGRVESGRIQELTINGKYEA